MKSTLPAVVTVLVILVILIQDDSFVTGMTTSEKRNLRYGPFFTIFCSSDYCEVSQSSVISHMFYVIKIMIFHHGMIRLKTLHILNDGKPKT